VLTGYEKIVAGCLRVSGDEEIRAETCDFESEKENLDRRSDRVPNESQEDATMYTTGSRKALC